MALSAALSLAAPEAQGAVPGARSQLSLQTHLPDFASCYVGSTACAILHRRSRLSPLTVVCPLIIPFSSYRVYLPEIRHALILRVYSGYALHSVRFQRKH